jgi:Flp pilus assembly protein TadG
MPFASFARHIAETARRFAGANGGNIAVLFAIALLPILGFIGAAIDYSRANKSRSSMQAALDSAALMLSKDLASGTISTSDIPTKAHAYFTALYTDRDAQNISVNATYTAENGSMGSTIQLTGSGQITTEFMKIAGFPTMGFGVSSTTAWGNARLRVAMALDNTGSMSQDGKMAALQNAATGTGGLIDQLSKLAKTPGDVYISVIPFAKVVNVDSTNYNQNWIDWTDWLNPPTAQPNNGSHQATLPSNWHAVGPGAICPFTNTKGGFVCTTGPTNGSSTSKDGNGNNVVPSSGTYRGYICPSADYNSHAFYNGCWTSEPTNNIETFCSGSSSCSCNNLDSGSSCTCTGNGSGKSCSAYTYVHNWTQPGVVAPVGYPARKWTASSSTPTIANNWTQASTNPISTWTGCVADRTQPNDATAVLPTTSDVTTQFPANQYYENSTSYCASNSSPRLAPVIPLSADWSALKTAINKMKPTGGTNQAIGLSLAVQSLLQGGPFAVPAEDPNYTYNRAIILLSDGLNTEDRWPDYGNGNTQFNSSIDTRQALLCEKLKEPDPKTKKPLYTIYTIQVNTGSPGDPTSTVLQNCASSPDKFYIVTSSSQIVTAFNSIGTSLSQLRVAR